MKHTPNLPIWTIDHSEYIVNDRFLKLRADSCTTPQGGKVDRYYVLELNDWVNCIAIDEEDDVVMLRHYRHGIRKYLMEFIGGGVEEGELPEAAAKRELKKKRDIREALSFMLEQAIQIPPAIQTGCTLTWQSVGRLTKGKAWKMVKRFM